ATTATTCSTSPTAPPTSGAGSACAPASRTPSTAPSSTSTCRRAESSAASLWTTDGRFGCRCPGGRERLSAASASAGGERPRERVERHLDLLVAVRGRDEERFVRRRRQVHARVEQRVEEA